MGPRLVARLLTLAALAALAPSPAHAATADPAGPGCDRLDDAACLLPFPDDHFTTSDPATDTGRRLAFTASQMPRNAQGTPIDPAPLNAFDGFSPGSVILTKVPGLDNPAALLRTLPVGLYDLSRYRDRHAPVLVLDARTGRRQPIWVELDSNAATDADRLLEIHPARNFREGRRYVVVLRSLRHADGSVIEASPAFAALRDRRARIPRYDRIFATLHRAKVARDRSLFLAWDFTVASERSLSARMLHIRDDAFARLGDRNLRDLKVQGSAPSFRITSVTDFTPEQNPYLARWIDGEITVPCYLDQPGCPPGSRFNYARPGDFLPTAIPGNVMTAPFRCTVPRSATPDKPARLSLYGHGLLGQYTEVRAGNVQLMANEHDIVFCATWWAGMSNPDIGNAITVLQDLGRMPTIADRLQQGMLNFLYLGRLMVHPQGLVTSPALRAADGRPLIDPSHLFYDGNSQGGIMGGALTPFAPDYTRAVLGVPAMNYSVLLPRSVDFDTYALVLYPAYPDELERPLALDLAQLLWDRGEADGVAWHMTDDPLPDTPRHTVLMHPAFGDHQVTNFQADVEARTIGARIHQPAVAPGRPLELRPFWGIPEIHRYPYKGSAIVYWDSGPQNNGPNPLANVPNRSGRDPHEDPRATAAARVQKSAFLQPDGAVIDVCGGQPCVATRGPIPAP
jgi:hypothetical protein